MKRTKPALTKSDGERQDVVKERLTEQRRIEVGVAVGRTVDWPRSVSKSAGRERPGKGNTHSS